MSKLTVLSLGAGQDSTAILYKLIHDPAFRARYAPGRLLVVFSDTGNEHPETYQHLDYVKALCAWHGIEFAHLQPGMGYHKGKWTSLQHFYEATRTCGSKAFRKSCSDNLKIRPIYRFLEHWLHWNYGTPVGRKRGFYAFHARHGRIRVLLGIAKGEERRASTAGGKWMRQTVERCYPLIDLGWDRRACQKYIHSLGLPVPVPSQCIMCPYKSAVEVLWTARKYPSQFARWVEIERRKLARFVYLGDKNMGVFGRRTLAEVLAEAAAMYKDWTEEDLEAYRMSHGHCVRSKY